MPHYMQTTEAHSRRSNRSDSPDLREKYPKRYEDREEVKDRSSPDYPRKTSPEDYIRRSSGERRTPDKYERRSPETRSPEKSVDRYRGGTSDKYGRRNSFGRRSPEKRSPESRYQERRSPETRSPERRYQERRSSERRSPDRGVPDRKSPGRRSSESRFQERRSPDLYERRDDRYGRLESEKKSSDYGRRSSTESFQTVKIKKSDLDEIRRKYDLRYKEKNQNELSEDNRMDTGHREIDSRDNSNIYKYSSNLTNSTDSGRSISTGSSSAERRSKIDSSGRKTKPRKKAEWRVITVLLSNVHILDLFCRTLTLLTAGASPS